MFIVIDKSLHEEHFSQQLQTNKELLKKAVTFLSGHSCIFNDTTKNKNSFSYQYQEELNTIKLFYPKRFWIRIFK